MSADPEAGGGGDTSPVSVDRPGPTDGSVVQESSSGPQGPVGDGSGCKWTVTEGP